jgi:hypothetical protein
MSGVVLPFPGVDLAAVADAPCPIGKSLIIREHGGWFVIGIVPADKPGWNGVRDRFPTAQAARARAGRLICDFPRLFLRVVDRTGTTRPSLGEIIAGAPHDGGWAA